MENRQYIDATSPVITKTEKIKKGSDTSKILQDAAIGAGAAALLELLTGDNDIDIFRSSNWCWCWGFSKCFCLRKKTVEVIVIEPEKDLDVTLGSDLTISLPRN